MRSFLLQGLLAGLVCFCVLGILGWGYEGLSLSGMNRAFEETDYFCETVEEIIRDKITAQQDILLFEEDGEYNELKEIDIQQYVSDTSQNQEPNPNTSYYICDLIEFGEDGAARMQSRINSLMNAGSGGNDLSAGRVLYNESAVLETIYPVSGHSLADYAQISSNPDAAVLETYRTLCDVSRDIAYRYRNYTEMQEGGEDPVKAPSNVYYYVEDYNTGSRYTNLGVKSLVAARTLVSEKENVRLLFEGDRRFNIMVSAADHPVNDNTSVYFMQSRFTGNSESVLIAYDTTYAAGDELQSSAVFYRQRKPYLIRALAVGIAALILLAGLLLACVADAFRYGSTASPRRRSAFPAGFEAVPTEIISCISRKIKMMLDYVESGESSKIIPRNYYSKNQAILYPQSTVFKEISQCDATLQRVSIAIYSKKDFLSYVPQLASYYSTANSINFVAIGLSTIDIKSIKASLKLLEIGDNVSISFVDNDKGLQFDYTIESTIKPFVNSRQLSLFDMIEGE